MKIAKRNNQDQWNNIYEYPLEDNILLWIPEWNKYIVTNVPANIIFSKILDNESSQSIIDYCVRQLQMQLQKAIDTEKSFRDFLNDLKKQSEKDNIEGAVPDKGHTDSKYFSKKYYNIGTQTFEVDYPDAWVETLIHPKFAHFEIAGDRHVNHHFQIMHSNEKYYLLINGLQSGSWAKEKEHFLTGKFSMQILQKIYDKEENEWIGIFHAAGITDRKSCLMFLGDSGNGKSTLSSILMAQGFDVLSDDFMPIEASANMGCRFPAAISVKKEALGIISKQFPEIEGAKEYNNPILNKTFRYLPVSNSDLICVPCKALIFIKYDQEESIEFEEMSHVEALQLLIPDSWISQEPRNVQQFIDWFKNIPCYRLTYSDNWMMIKLVKKLFNDEVS